MRQSEESGYTKSVNYNTTSENNSQKATEKSQIDDIQHWQSVQECISALKNRICDANNRLFGPFHKSRTVPTSVTPACASVCVFRPGSMQQIKIQWQCGNTRAPRTEQDLLIDNFDAQRAGRANDAPDDRLQGGILHFEAFILGFHLGDFVHRSYWHHPCCFVACTHPRDRQRVNEQGIMKN